MAGICRPWRDLSAGRDCSPTVETVGYFRESLAGQREEIRQAECESRSDIAYVPQHGPRPLAAEANPQVEGWGHSCHPLRRNDRPVQRDAR